MNNNENNFNTQPLQQLIPVNEVKVEEPVVIQPVQVDRTKKSKRPLIVIIVIVLIALLIAFFVFGRGNKETPGDEKCDPEVENCEEDTNPPIVKDYWDPDKSLIVEVEGEDVVRLVCSLEEEHDGLTFSSVFTVLFINEAMVQLIVEDMTKFNEDTMRFYDFFEGAAREDFAELDGNYQNFIYELRLRENEISIAVSVDMSADQTNLRNIFEFTWEGSRIRYNMTLERVREILTQEGYSC